MSNTELIKAGNDNSWELMREQAKVLVASRFLPTAIDTPEKAIAVMLTGVELGIPKMQALRQIVVIQGKPTLSAELMAALIYRAHGDDALRFTETTAERCTIAYKRRGWAKADTYSFTLQDAKEAGLLGKAGGNWERYRPAMLRARAISAVARIGFPDVIGGMYTAEELDATVKVDPNTGEMQVVEGTAVEIVHNGNGYTESAAQASETVQTDTNGRRLGEAGRVLATEQQLAEINQACERLGWGPKQLRELAISLKIPPRSAELNGHQADELLEALSEKLGELAEI